MAVLDAADSVLVELLFLKREEASYYVRRRGGEDVWSVSRFTVEDFLKPAKDFRPASGS